MSTSSTSGGWNRPSAAPKPPAKKPGAMRGFVVVLALVALGVACWLLMSGGEGAGEKRRNDRKIADVGRGKGKSAEDLEKEKAKAEARAKAAQWAASLRQSSNSVNSVSQAEKPKPFVVGRRRNQVKQLFKMPCENELDALVNTAVGGTFYGDVVPEDFLEQFKASLTNKIVITENDPPDIADRKERVIAAKEELRKAYEAGEDIVALVKKTTAEMSRKFDDYCEFEHQLFKLRSANASPEEIAEYAIAAKAVMESHGIEEHLPLSADDREAVRKLNKLIGLKSDEPDPEPETPEETQSKENQDDQAEVEN